MKNQHGTQHIIAYLSCCFINWFCVVTLQINTCQRLLRLLISRSDMQLRILAKDLTLCFSDSLLEHRVRLIQLLGSLGRHGTSTIGTSNGAYPAAYSTAEAVTLLVEIIGPFQMAFYQPFIRLLMVDSVLTMRWIFETHSCSILLRRNLGFGTPHWLFSSPPFRVGATICSSTMTPLVSRPHLFFLGGLQRFYHHPIPCTY
jgi:hypothetical protein